MNEVKVTFGMIVLNGEPFVRYNLRSIYPYAHQIIVVEGACPAAKNVAMDAGHSRDTTLDTLRRFKAEEDPDNKLIIVTAEDEGYPDGFWPGEKDEMSQAYAKRATGNYLWQVDSDEFYKAEDTKLVIQMLETDTTITVVEVEQCPFWGGFNYVVDGYWYKRFRCARIFKWGVEYSYVKHRPPTVCDELGMDLRDFNVVSARSLSKLGIRMYHYQSVLPQQVKEKADYYCNVDWDNFTQCLRWAEESYLRLRWPYHIDRAYMYYSWLGRFKGRHPEAIEQMQIDIASGRLVVDLRQTADIDRLVDSWTYRLGICVLILWYPLRRVLLPLYRTWSYRFKLLFFSPAVFLARLRKKLSTNLIQKP